jgi:predicted O-methyltransferase YrrM
MTASRTIASPMRLGFALTLSAFNSAGARMLPLWRGLRGLAGGMKGWRAARAADEAREAVMDRLVARLGWTRDALPTPDGWAGSPDLLWALAEQVAQQRPRLIVEFGSGLSTLVMARVLQQGGIGARLISFDHLESFAELTRWRLAGLGLAAEVRSVPLEDAARWGYAGEWYAADDLPGAIELLVIDGPPAWLNEGARGAAAPALFPRMAPGGVILLDDADRDGERANAERWRAEFPHIRFELLPSHKGLLKGTVGG